MTILTLRKWNSRHYVSHNIIRWTQFYIFTPDICNWDHFTVEWADAPPIVRLDPSHPSLMAFDIAYRWKAVHDSDLRIGVVTMFISTLLLLVLLICYVFYTYDRDIATPKMSDHGSNSNIRRPQGPTAASRYRWLLNRTLSLQCDYDDSKRWISCENVPSQFQARSGHIP